MAKNVIALTAPQRCACQQDSDKAVLADSAGMPL